MPRPGPRPYECVRRAWHSDRHHPMRGSIIQQIFRVVNEAHSAATKKNKEWQEKLPIVVLKAEEIMYSKANSEAEYLNPETLWDRVNDAINTIIRRDESSETGELLPPCVEAALNLGCIPVRASRSQRHNNPRCYLSPRVPEPVCTTPRVNGEQCPPISPLHSGNQLTFARVTTTMTSSFPVSQSNCHMTDNSYIASSRSNPFQYENIPPGLGQSATQENSMHLNVGSVYPLYYGNHITEPQLISEPLEKTHSHTVFVGKPISTPTADIAKKGVLQNFFSSSDNVVSNRAPKADNGKMHEKLSGKQCDLSLRLGFFLDNVEINKAQETEDVGSNSSQDQGKFSNCLPPASKEFCFFPSSSTNDPFESCSMKWSSKDEDQSLEANVTKRKAPFGDNVEDEESYQQHRFFSNKFDR